MLYLCAYMSKKNQKENDVKQLNDADIFREKAMSYLVCFLHDCPLRSTCLRYLVGEYGRSDIFVQIAINPHNPQVAKACCPMYRDNKPKLMKYGFTHLYDDMPGRMERHIRYSLIGYLGRKKYFEMRKGQRPITPDHQYIIERVCRENGWTGPITYDGEDVEYEW